MKNKELNGVYTLLLAEDEEIISSVAKFCEEKDIAAAQVSAIGAVKSVELGFYSLESKAYKWKKAEAELEIDSLTGNVALLDGKILVHAHATVSDAEMHAFGGHLKEAIVGASCEVFITPLQGKLERKHDEKTGLNLLKFD